MLDPTYFEAAQVGRTEQSSECFTQGLLIRGKSSSKQRVDHDAETTSANKEIRVVPVNEKRFFRNKEQADFAI